MIRFILGGARSGKSGYAEQLALASGKAVTYIATAQCQDQEMLQRIQHHRQHRPAHWQTLEVPLDLAQVISEKNNVTNCLIVDCLTLWLTNLLCGEYPVASYRAQLLHQLAQAQGELILVSNETGLGVVPLGELSRRYVDEAGWLHQAIAAQADQVILMVAGLPTLIKGERDAINP